MKACILVIILSVCSILKAQEKQKDTLFFSVDKYYTVSPTVVSNLSGRTYPQSIEFEKEQKKHTKTNGYIFFVGDGFLTKGLKPKKILSIKDYIENRKFYCDGKHNQIIDKWKLKEFLIDKYVIFFVNGNEFIQPRHLEYNSYYPLRQEDQVVQNPTKDTLYFKLDYNYIYPSKFEPNEYWFKDNSGSNHGTFFLKKIDAKVDDFKNSEDVFDFKDYIHNSRFYDKTKLESLQDGNLADFLSNYVLFLVTNSGEKKKYIQVKPVQIIE